MSMLLPLQPQKQRKSLGDQIYESIRDSIVAFRLEPGSMIYENELAEALNVSRTPVREAIRLLVSEQLLDVLPQRGTRISLISARKVSEARFVREQLELGAFRLAARRWKEQNRDSVSASIEMLIEQQQEAYGQADYVQFLQLDEAFHRVILEVAGNETLLQVINHMRAHVNRARFLALRQYGQAGQVIEEHRLLLQAVQQGDEMSAAQLLEQHIGKLDEELPMLRGILPHYFQD